MIPILNYTDKDAIKTRLLSRSQLTNEEITARVKAIVADVRTRGDEALFDAQAFDGGDDYRLFILGDALREIEARRLCFPALSHA